MLSVIVPMLDAEAHLARCLEALLGQDAPGEYEVVLVDNGSTDASVSIARRYPRARLLHEPRRGAYAARNLGVRAARGELLAFTDPDCVPDRAWLRGITAAFADPRVELVCGRRVNAGSFLVGLAGSYEAAKDEYVLGSGEASLYYGYCCNMALRRGTFDRLGPFPELERGGDTVLVRRVVEASTPAAVRHVPAAEVTHLEVDGLTSYYRKIFLYGHHRRRGNRLLPTRSLELAERLAVYRAARRGHPGVASAAALLGVLAVGWLAWTAGSATGRLGLLLPDDPPCGADGTARS